MKKILLSIWLVIAVAVFIAGMIVLFLIKDFTIYLLWSAGCTVPCLLYLFYDYFANHGGGFIMYFILSVLLGTVILLYFIFCVILEVFRGKKVMRWVPSSGRFGHRTGGYSNYSEHSNSTTSSANDTYGNSCNETYEDNRETDFGLSAIEKAVSRAIGYVKHEYRFDYGYIGKSWSINKTVSRLFGIRISGTVDVEITGGTLATEEWRIRDAIIERANDINQNLVDYIGEEIDKVRERYKGYDNEWSISSEIQPRII